MITSDRIMIGTTANLRMVANAFAGTYDFRMEWTPEAQPGDPAAAEAVGPSIFTAIQDQIGLKLK